MGLKIFSGLFVKPAVKHNGNELGYAKSAKSNVVNLIRSRLIKNHFWENLVNFGPNIFFQESENVSLSVKDPLKKYIKRLETHVHNRLERKGLTDFRSGITLDHISHAIVADPNRSRISI